MSRLPRNRRVAASDRPAMRLTRRDVEIIRAVAEYRVLKAAHIQALFFGSASSCQYRLVRLFQHGYLQRHFAPIPAQDVVISSPMYTLDRRGAQVLIDGYGYEAADLSRPKKDFSWQFLDHLLSINEVRIAITLSAASRQWPIEKWEDERVYRQAPDYVIVTSNGTNTEKPVLPDGYFCLVTPRGRAHFFLEIDRGSEPERTFKPQIEVYQQYTEKSTGYVDRYQTQSLRILIVTTTQKRLTKLKKVTAKAGGDSKYWFTTLAQVTPDTVLTGSIWERLTETGCHPLISL